MLTRIEQAEQKWGGIHKLIDTWLEERKTLLVQYCQLAGLPPFENSNNALPGNQQIEQFCETLMDYASTGHFELYDKILDECNQNGNDQNQIEEIAEQIKATTDTALSFNDSYAEPDEEQDMSAFVKNLTLLGETLELRFELEDKLLESIQQPAS